MYLHESVKALYTKYDREAFESLDKLSNNQAYKLNELTTTAVNLNEAFEKFDLYLKGYIDYKIESVGNSKAMNQEQITGATHNLVDNQLFTDHRILYSDIQKYVESYMNGVGKLLKTIDDGRTKLFESGIDNMSIGALEEYSEYFIDKLNERFYPFIENMLWASGYKSRKKLRERKTPEVYTFL